MTRGFGRKVALERPPEPSSLDTFKRGKYQDTQAELRGRKLENLDPQLRKIAGFAFYNTSRYDFDKLLADAPARAR